MSPRLAARRLTGRAKLLDLPINPIELLRLRRVRVIRLPLDAMEAFTARAGSTIWVALGRGRTPEQRRWAAAHELGHVELDHVREPGIRWDSQEGRDLCHQANVFASELLMPRRLVWRAWLDLEGDVDRMARLFGVTPAVMEERLEGLLGARTAPFDRTWVSIH